VTILPRKKLILASFLGLASQQIAAYDNALFFRATPFFGEPRLERKTLSSLDISLGSGATRKGRNQCGQSVPVFDLYGKQNMHELGVGVPGKDPTNPLDLILIDLAATPGGDCFGIMSACGKFALFESNIVLNQNLARGFYAQFYLPVRRFHVYSNCFRDCTPACDCPDRNNQVWQNFLDNFNAILERYCLSTCGYKEADVGDLAIELGWSHSYQETTELDFVDLGFKAGVLFPTGKRRNVDRIFSIPFGYNGHYGIPISMDLAVGACEWMTLGVHFEAIPLIRRKQRIRVKTSPTQSGLIKLTKTCANVDPGTVLTGGAFFKADHFARCISFLVGYSFAHQGDDAVSLCDTICIDSCAVCSDEQFKAWKMHTLNARVEIDFATESCPYGFRVGFFYDWNFGGQRIFQTDVGGTYLGFDATWDF